MSNWEPVDGPSSLGLSRNDGAFRIVLQRPDVLNALDTAASQALLDVLREIADDDSVRSVLITGAGRAFSAGADIGNQFGDDEARSVIERDMREITNPTIVALRELRKPVVAAVNGPAAGVGCSIALASDLVVVAESAFFLLAFSNIGLTPDGGASLLVPARVGLGRAFVLALLAERLPAKEAVAWGLADRVVPDAELPKVTEELAVRLAQGPTRAYAATKEAINRSTLAGLRDALDTEATLQGRLVWTEDFREGTAAFGERRPPRFTGR